MGGRGDVPDVVKAEFFEEGAALDEAACVLVDFGVDVLCWERRVGDRRFRLGTHVGG